VVPTRVLTNSCAWGGGPECVSGITQARIAEAFHFLGFGARHCSWRTPNTSHNFRSQLSTQQAAVATTRVRTLHFLVRCLHKQRQPPGAVPRNPPCSRPPNMGDGADRAEAQTRTRRATGTDRTHLQTPIPGSQGIQQAEKQAGTCPDVRQPRTESAHATRSQDAHHVQQHELPGPICCFANHSSGR
jgi:hypothetical protein